MLFTANRLISSRGLQCTIAATANIINLSHVLSKLFVSLLFGNQLRNIHISTKILLPDPFEQNLGIQSVLKSLNLSGPYPILVFYSVNSGTARLSIINQSSSHY